MSPGLGVDEVARKIQETLTRPNPLLFAGAGVGCRVGFPDWKGYMEHLAMTCDKFNDSLSGALIRQRTERRQYLAAASVFKTCDSIPLGERWKAIAEPFGQAPSTELVQRLTPLVDLPFTAIVTTNYDRSLHEASSLVRRGWVMPVERGDGSLSGAMFRRDFFIARIHGRAELATSMVVDTQDYTDLGRDSAYLDFLMDVLKSRTCFFVGFSFLDPAISHVLRLYEEKFGPTFDALHAALIPANADELGGRLRALNIDTIPYDPADEHANLWRAVRGAHEAQSRVRVGAVVGAAPPRPTATLHRFMAFAYAQLQSGTHRQSVASIVQDGMVMSVLSPKSGEGMAEDAIAEKLRLDLRVSQEEARQLVGVSVERLAARRQIIREGELVWRGDASNALEAHLTELAESVLDRMQVRDGIRVTPGDKTAATNVLESIFVARAWDLAAHYAGSATGWGADLAGVVNRIVDEQLGGRKPSVKRPMEMAIVDLLTAPEDRETPLLAELGRAAFGVQLVLSTPRQALFQKFALPQRLYLDSNVLMPAITDGHPLRLAYVTAIRRLAEAAEQHELSLEMAVGKQFLNEIVSHRRLGREIVREEGLEQLERLRKHILFYTAVNTNVFIGAYASHVGREGKPVSFETFLQEVAPYETEEALAAYLRQHKIIMTEMDFRQRNNKEFAETFASLRLGYEESPDPNAREKQVILIEHEAQQITQLFLDNERGYRSIFVTADNQLRRVLQQQVRLRTVAGMCVSKLGLVALADVMVGLDADARSLVRLVWAAPSTSEEQAIFDYFVRLGLRQYEEGMATEMQEIARKVASEAAAAAVAEGVELFGRELSDVTATARLLDQYENMFFRYWREALEQRRREEN